MGGRGWVEFMEGCQQRKIKGGTWWMGKDKKDKKGANGNYHGRNKREEGV